MLKAVVILAVGLAGAALAVVPALADSQTVTAGSSTWDRTQIAIRPGESVTFSNPPVSGGFHNLFIDGTKVQPDGTNWTYVANGLSAGQHSFECSIHAAMKGTITVASTSTGDTAPPPPGPPTSPGPPPPPVDTAPTFSLPKHNLGTFCIRHCRHPGVRFAVNTDQDGTLLVVLLRWNPARRSWRSIGVLKEPISAGTNHVRFTKVNGRTLAAGKYRAGVVAMNTSGSANDVQQISFAIR